MAWYKPWTWGAVEEPKEPSVEETTTNIRMGVSVVRPTVTPEGAKLAVHVEFYLEPDSIGYHKYLRDVIGEDGKPTKVLDPIEEKDYTFDLDATEKQIKVKLEAIYKEFKANYWAADERSAEAQSLVGLEYREDYWYKELCQIYVAAEQMRLEHNRQGAIARSNWPKYKDKWYRYALRPNHLGGNVYKALLLPILQEQNRLKDEIRRARYSDSEWRSITRGPYEQKQEVFLSLFGDRTILKKQSLIEDAPLWGELRRVDLDNVLGIESSDPIQDFTTYTELDGGNDITVTASKCAVDSMRRDVESAVYKAIAIPGNFEHLVKITYNGNGGVGVPVTGLWAVTGLNKRTMQEMDAGDEGIQVAMWDLGGFLDCVDWSNSNNDYYAVGGPAWTRWLTIARTDTTLVVTAYTDAERTAEEDNITITCTNAAFTHVQGAFSDERGNGDTYTYDVEDLDLQQIGIPIAMHHYKQLGENT